MVMDSKIAFVLDLAQLSNTTSSPLASDIVLLVVTLTLEENGNEETRCVECCEKSLFVRDLREPTVASLRAEPLLACSLFVLCLFIFCCYATITTFGGPKTKEASRKEASLEEASLKEASLKEAINCFFCIKRSKTRTCFFWEFLSVFFVRRCSAWNGSRAFRNFLVR
jgi:hypothetical protein